MLARALKKLFQVFMVAVIVMLPASHSYAEIVTVEAEGTYLVGDGLNENINLAKELARREALRNASERAGIYVQSYSVTSNNTLTKDEVTVVSASILQIIKQECFPEVEGKNIKFVYRIKANIDVSNLNEQIERVLNNKEVLRKNVVLEKRISSLEKENISLKNSYNNAMNKSQKDLYQKLILENENNIANTFRYTERLPKCEMVIGDIKFGIPLGEIRKKYGNPVKVEKYNIDWFSVVHYSYKNMVVSGDAARKAKIPNDQYKVYRVHIKDSSLSMPCGIRVGDSYLKVVERFGIGSKYIPNSNKDKVGYGYLLQATLEGMYFIVDNNGIICEMGTYIEH